MSKKLIKQVNTRIVTYCDGTVITREREFVEKELISERVETMSDKMKRKKSKDRILKNSIESRHYFFESGDELVTEKHYRFTPKKQEKKLEKDIVRKIDNKK